MADYSGTVAVGGTAQVAAAADVNRATLFVENPGGDDVWIRFGGTAAAASPSYLVEAGTRQMWGQEWRPLITQAISVISATTSQPFTITDTKM